MDTDLARMRRREIVRALSVVELIFLCAWCILALVLKLLNLCFAGLHGVLGKRFEEVLAPLPTETPPVNARSGEYIASLECTSDVG